jgi:hypothetical protein
MRCQSPANSPSASFAASRLAAAGVGEVSAAGGPPGTWGRWRDASLGQPGAGTQGRVANLCTKLCTRPRSILADARSRCERRRSVVGVAGFEPATPSSRTRSEAGRSLKIQRFSSRSRTFVRIRFARSCGRTCGRRTIRGSNRRSATSRNPLLMMRYFTTGDMLCKRSAWLGPRRRHAPERHGGAPLPLRLVISPSSPAGAGETA